MTRSQGCGGRTRRPIEMMGSSKLWRLLAGLGVVVVVVVLLGPTQCVAHSGGGSHTEVFWKQYETIAGFDIRLPYASEPGGGYRAGPTSPNWPPIIMLALATGMVSGIACFFLVTAKRGELDDLLTAKGG